MTNDTTRQLQYCGSGDVVPASCTVMYVLVRFRHWYYSRKHCIGESVCHAQKKKYF